MSEQASSFQVVLDWATFLLELTWLCFGLGLTGACVIMLAGLVKAPRKG